MILLLELSDNFSEDKYNAHKKRYDQIREKIETQTCKIINEIRKTINNKEETDPYTKNTTVTATFGVAFYDKSVSNYDDLISRADKSLYLAKENGRNCIGYYHDGKALIFDG